MTVEEALSALNLAASEHTEAASRESAARSEATSALNRLNEAQREFDKSVAEIRKLHGVWNSDWARKTSTEGRAQ